MMRLISIVLLSAPAAAIILIISFGSAHAYIDPGTGSYILQIVLAGLLGAAFTVRIFWKRIKMFFLYSVLKRTEPGEDRPDSEGK